MSSQVPVAFIKQYDGRLHMVLEQEGSKLMGTVRNEAMNSKAAHFDRLGNVEAMIKTVRHSVSEQTDTPHSRRQLTMTDYFVKDFIDKEDKLRMIIDPTSPYAVKQAHAIGRSMDNVIITALNGNATAVDESDATSSVALPSTQIIDEDFGTADSNITVEKIIEAKRLLMKIPGALNEQGILVMNASAHAALLNIEKATSMDYGTRNLETGKIDTFLGFKIIVLGDGLLPGTADGTDTDPVRCFAFTPSACILGKGTPSISSRIDQIPERHYTNQIYTSSSFGAVRMEEELVVAIECVQAA